MEDFSKDHSPWDSRGEDLEPLPWRLQENSSVEILEIIDGKKTKTKKIDADLEEWLVNSSSWPRAQFRILFIDENNEDTNRICVSRVALEKIFRALSIRRRYLDIFAARSCGSRVVKYDDNNRLSWHEFWYSAVHWSPPNPEAIDPAKKLLGWSFMNAWMGCHAHNGDITMLITRCPVAIKRSFLQQPTEDFELYLRYPMTLHLYFLRNNAQNHWKTLKSLMQDLHVEEQRVDTQGEDTQTLAERSRRLLFICRQFSTFLVDSDLAQSLVERVMKENVWFVEQFLPPKRERKMWRHAYESLAENLSELLYEFKTNSRYAQSCGERAKIGVDESFSKMSQNDSSTNVSIAKRGEENARTLEILQLLALFFLPLSLATSVFGMGFFSTQTNPKGNAALYVAPQWWYFLAFGMPSVSVMYLIVFAWKRSKKLKGSGAKTRDEAQPFEVRRFRTVCVASPVFE